MTKNTNFKSTPIRDLYIDFFCHGPNTLIIEIIAPIAINSALESIIFRSLNMAAIAVFFKALNRIRNHIIAHCSICCFKG